MNSVVSIQTIVNENRDKMPGTTAKEITEHCRKFFVGKRVTYKVNLTWVHIATHVNFYDSDYDDPYVVTKSVHQTQTLFVEGINERPDDLCITEDLLNRGQALTSWMSRPMPLVFGTNRSSTYFRNRLCFINSMERMDKAPDEAHPAKPPVKKRQRSKAKQDEEEKEPSEASASTKEEENHIGNIQTIVDEQREHMPTGAATEIMNQCQKAFENPPKLYKVHLSWVYIIAFTLPNEEDCTEPTVQLRTIHQEQTVFAEGVTHSYKEPGFTPEMLHRGKVPIGWMDMQKPIVFGTENGNSLSADTLCLVHAMELVEPPVPNKRGRVEE